MSDPEAATLARRTTLSGLADVLVPAHGDLPAASSVDVHGRWLDRTLTARPDIAERLWTLLDALANREPDEAIGQLGATAPDDLEFLLDVVSGAYYMSPKVRKRLRYPGQKATLPLPDEPDHYLRDGLLDPVVARGPIYRRTP